MFRLLLSGFDGFLGYESGVPQHSSRKLRHPNESNPCPNIDFDPIRPIREPSKP